jgi:hypothetical protein
MKNKSLYGFVKRLLGASRPCDEIDRKRLTNSDFTKINF